MYITLITKPSYLAGAIILAFSLQRSASRFPLVVLYTEALGENATELLKGEAKRNTILLPLKVEPLDPPTEFRKPEMLATRFSDTFTKLRAFDPAVTGKYDKCVFLDADMAALKNPDALFDIELAFPNRLAANHACTCFLDYEKWAAKEGWRPKSCAYSYLTTNGSPSLSMSIPDAPRGRPLLNSGMFVFEPNEEVWESMTRIFYADERLRHYQLPDQEFLSNFFILQWRPLSWKYDAPKTMRNWHPTLWDDNEVVMLHYVIDKPWDTRIATDGIAGYRGLDGETHRWWWDLYAEWAARRVSKASDEYIVYDLNLYMAAPLNPRMDQQQKETNRRKGFKLSNGAVFQEPSSLGKREASEVDGLELYHPIPKRPIVHSHNPVS